MLQQMVHTVTNGLPTVKTITITSELYSKRVLTQNIKHADTTHTDCLKEVELTCSYTR